MNPDLNHRNVEIICKYKFIIGILTKADNVVGPTEDLEINI